MKNRKALFFDIDGTLFSEILRQVPQSAVLALKKTRENSQPEEFFKTLPDFDVIDRGNGFYECVPLGHSKATIIEMVLKKYGIAKNEKYSLTKASIFCIIILVIITIF